MRDLFDICTPRKDVLRGHVKESDFAADLAQVLNRMAPPEYQKPEVFFANSVPNDFDDRCPKCKSSATDAKRKARLSQQ